MPPAADRPSDDPLDAAVAAAAALAGLTIAEAHRPGVRTHLAAGLGIAARIGETGREAAPTFRP